MIQACRLIPYRLPLTRAWHSALGRFTEREGCLIEICSSDGLKAYGDCAPLPVMGTETLDQASRWLSDKLSMWEGISLETGLEKISTIPQRLSATRCALELALLDLQAQQAGLPLARCLNPNAATSVQVNAVLGISHQEHPISGDDGIKVFKIKIGMQSPAQEIRRLQILCEQLPAQAQLRLDANGAWGLDEATTVINALKGLPIESLEEPLSEPDPEGLRALQAMAPFPLALDESLPRFSNTLSTASYPVRRLVLKPMVLGGLRSALELANRAYQADLDCVVTSTVDSAVGVWGAVHLAAALAEPGQHLAHGLATSGWLQKDIALPPAIDKGRINLSEKPGLGIVLI